MKLVVEGQKASASYWGFYSPPGYGHCPAGDLGRPASAQNPPNALVSHSSLGPHSKGYALQAEQPRVVDPINGKLAEGAPPGWGGTLLPGLVQAAAGRGAPREAGDPGG